MTAITSDAEYAAAVARMDALLLVADMTDAQARASNSPADAVWVWETRKAKSPEDE